MWDYFIIIRVLSTQLITARCFRIQILSKFTCNSHRMKKLKKTKTQWPSNKACGSTKCSFSTVIKTVVCGVIIGDNKKTMAFLQLNQLHALQFVLRVSDVKILNTKSVSGSLNR